MDTSVNERLNTMNHSVEAKKKPQNRQNHSKNRKSVRTYGLNIKPNDKPQCCGLKTISFNWCRIKRKKKLSRIPGTYSRTCYFVL